MATVTLQKVEVKAKLNNGTDASGNDKFVTISLGNLSEEHYDPDNALAIVTALAPCLSKTVSRVEEHRTSTLSAA